MSDQIFDNSMLDIYIFEASQLIEQLETVVLDCERSNLYTADSINEIFRIMHTIKGSASIMNYTNIAKLAHVLEDTFSLLREQVIEQADYSALSDLLLDGIDFMKIELQKVKDGHEVDGEASVLIERTKSYLAHLQKTTDSIHTIRSFQIVMHFHEANGMENFRAFQVVRHLKKIADIISFEPSDIEDNHDTAAVIVQQGFQLCMQTERKAEEIHSLLNKINYLKSWDLIEQKEDNAFEEPFNTEDSTVFEEVILMPEENPSTEQVIHAKHERMTAEETLSTKTARQPSQQASFISVHVTKLDELMDLVGELVIAEAMVTQNPELVELELEQLQKATRHLRKVTNEIQDKVMSIRMVPLTNTFQKMHRLIRDMSKKLTKDVQLQLIGEETEVDKSIIENLSDPLMHMVRNAIDHGLEPTEERLANGKPKIGTVTLEAKHAGSEVVLFIKDDGRGLNKDKMLARAKQNGLLHKHEEDMSDRDIYNLIFLPGFSTKEHITEFSGRGVGMDVVARNIAAIGGTIAVDSSPGEGTTMTVHIPLTLAIIDGMNVRIGSSRYTLSTTSIQESFRPAASDIIRDPEGNEMIIVRGTCYPIVRMHEKYRIQSDASKIEEGILIMVQQGDRGLCLFVDELLGQQQVVVKSLPTYIKNLRDVDGITGCTLLGDGSISLILDVPSLLQSY